MSVGRADLHLHSTASDGEFTPAQLVRMALEHGLAAIAITDHDTTEGVDEALSAATGTGLVVVPGVELSIDLPLGHRVSPPPTGTSHAPGEQPGEVHILGYYIDHHAPSLQAKLKLLRDSRRERARSMVAKLARLGMPLEWESILRLAGGGSIGRPHLAQAMVEKGYVSSTEEAFALYLGRGGPAYVERYKLTPLEAIRIIREAGGVAVLAHPLLCVNLLPELVEGGLEGLEAHYNGYGPYEVSYLTGLAHKYGLIVTGGSDFHGPSVLPSVKMGQAWVTMDVVEKLRERAHRQRPPRQG